MGAGDYMRFTFMCKSEKPIKRIDKRIAIVGAGPSGLATAGYLACKGYSITIFERLPYPGGMMVFGIPSFRIPRERVFLGCKELEDVFDVEIKAGCKVVGDEQEILGDDLVKEYFELQEVIDNFDATVIATGTWISKNLPALGYNTGGIYSALEYLYRNRASELKLIPKKEKIKLDTKVAVIGSGLVAIDAALDALGEGCDVKLISIEKLQEAPAGIHEVNKLKNQGVEHLERVVIKRVIGDKKVKALELIDVKAEIKGGLILKLEQILGTERIIEDIDNVVVAIGQVPTPPIRKESRALTLGIRLLRWGGIEINDNFLTSNKKVFATGDVATGASKVGRAFQAGLKTASWVDRRLQDNSR